MNQYSSIRCEYTNIIDESTKGHGDFDAEKESVFESNNNLFDNNEDANCMHDTRISGFKIVCRPTIRERMLKNNKRILHIFHKIKLRNCST